MKLQHMFSLELRGKSLRTASEANFQPFCAAGEQQLAEMSVNCLWIQAVVPYIWAFSDQRFDN